MDILYLHQHFSTHQGSGGIRSYKIAKKLIEKGHNVTMLCGCHELTDVGIVGKFVNGQRKGNFEGIKVIQINVNYNNKQNFAIRAIKFFKFAFLSIKYIFSEKYDLIFCTSTPLTVAIPGIVAKILLNKKFIFEVRDLWPELPKALGVIKNPIILFLMRILEISAYKSADICIGLAPGITDGIKNKNKVTIPNGCDLEIFTGIRNDLYIPELNDNDFVAIFAGAHGLANGLEEIIKTGEVLQKKREDNIKILLVGDGMMKKSLIKLKNKKGLENIIFMPPMVKKDLAKIFVRANIGLQVLKNISAFYNGTSPNKFFDYIASGLPVLINYPGWLSNIINEYKCGYVCRPEDPEDFANKLIFARENINEGNMQNSIKRVQKLYNWDVLAEKFYLTISSMENNNGR